MGGRALGVLSVALCALVLGACSDDSGDGGGGMAGAPAMTPGVGEPCVTTCQPGFVCERAGPFSGVCSADCNSDAACGLLVSGSICVGAPYFKCGVSCTTIDDCPTGTACVSLANRMTCTATGLQQTP
ncbi:MAG: hypothetical protein OXT09_31325 [Myxococcales bacterium]|nr:hypothetical protein [Myxococcales bacterium]